MTFLSTSIRSTQELEQYLVAQGLSWNMAQLPPIELFTAQFPVRIPTYYANLINWKNPSDPLRIMVVPDPREAQPKDYELSDPIGDHNREAVPGLIHRYPDRALLLLTSYCLVHCRFCFRREVVGKVRPVQFQGIQQYLAAHQEVNEIIFSGGDPFTFPLGFLHSMIEHFSLLSHIKVWRFHTRVLAVDPRSVTQEWMEMLGMLQTKFGIRVVIITHINHPNEVTPEFNQLVEKLRAVGCVLLSQTVLLKGVNTDTGILSQLFRALIIAGVKPYYLHHLDQVYGSHHFRISIAEGKKIFTSLRGNLSGISLPEYVLDLPGGNGKVPVMWLEKVSSKIYRTATFEGKIVEYIDHAD